MKPIALANVKNLAQLRQAQSAQQKKAAEQERAESVVAKFDKLESTFVSSNGTTCDHAKTDESRVVLNSKKYGNTGILAAFASGLAILAGPLAVPTPPPRAVSGVASLDNNNQVSKLEADVTGGSAWSKETMTMVVGENGDKTYEVFSSNGLKQNRTVVMESGGRLTILEDGEIQPFQYRQPNVFYPQLQTKSLFRA